MDNTVMEIAQIPKLESLALEVFYNEFIRKNSPNKVDLIQHYLDQQLWGKVQRSVRDECLHKSYMLSLSEVYKYLAMNKANHEEENSTTVRDISLDLDSLLDIHETKMWVPSSFPVPSLESFSTLMSVIGHRSPKIENLEIKFHESLPKTAFIHIAEIPAQPFHLNFLTNLCLHFDFLYEGHSAPYRLDEFHQSILSIVGKFCPVLSTLEIDCFCVKKRDILGLIVKPELAEILFASAQNKWSNDLALTSLRVPSELLNPLCSTLTLLSLKHSCYTYTQYIIPDEDCDCHPSVSGSTLAFALRHLSQLQGLHTFIPTSEVVKILYDAKEIQLQHQEELEKLFQDVASRIGRKLITSQQSSSSGLLSLVFVTVVITDADVVRAIGSMCPLLQRADFVTSSTRFDITISHSRYKKNQANVFRRQLHPQEFQSFVNGWPKLKEINLRNLDSAFMNQVFSAFGANLKSLRLTDCQNIDMHHMASCCPQLKNLGISKLYYNSTLGPDEEGRDPSCWTSDTFLPDLERVRSTACLEDWATLIERKPSLVEVELHCCHIGTEVYNPPLEWCHVPELWSRLECLGFKQCTGLTMTMVSALIPQFGARFQQMELPQSIMDNDTELTQKITEDISNGNRKVTIKGLPFKCMPSQLGDNDSLLINEMLNRRWAHYDKPCRFQLK